MLKTSLGCDTSQCHIIAIGTTIQGYNIAESELSLGLMKHRLLRCCLSMARLASPQR